jgi:hypothetical protein
VLLRAFGVTDKSFTGIGLTAATNIVVAITRPRELLGLAMRKPEAEKLIWPAEAQRWKLVDLVARAVGWQQVRVNRQEATLEKMSIGQLRMLCLQCRMKLSYVIEKE